MASQLSVSITPGDVLFRERPITISADEPIDPKSAQGEIRLDGRRVLIRLSDDGRTATVQPDGGLVPGRYRLLVGELLTPEGERFDYPFEVPFMVIDTRAELPDGLRAEHVTRIRVEEFTTARLPIDRHPNGPFIDLVKAATVDGDEPVRLAFDELGRRIDADEIFTALAERRAARFGRIHDTLYARLEEAATGERVPVAIWIRLHEEVERPEKPTDRRMDERPPEERRLDEIIADATRRFRATVAEFGDERAVADRHAPVVYANLPAERIRVLSQHDDVSGVFLHETEGVDDLVDSMAAAHSDDVHQGTGFTGNGINVAVWELGPDDEKDLNITARFQDPAPSTSSHARLTHAVIKNVEANHPHGHAPECNLHSANTYSRDALDWAVIDMGCTVVSQSFHRLGDASSGVLSFDDIYKDWLILRWPYPTILQAAGNFFAGDVDNVQPPSSEYVNHKGFNSLKVGNHDDPATAMSGSSVFRNPNSSHADRELPEIAANGTGITAAGVSSSGTSFATPAAAGCAALIQQVDSTLCSWPEGCRAILLASADRNPDGGGLWWYDIAAAIDGSDGSGALDALSAVHIAQTRGSRNAPGIPQGWDVGTLDSNDFNGFLSTFSYTVAVPNILSPRVKIALAWDSEVTETAANPPQPITSALTVDLDLVVADATNRRKAASHSFDNSYEIAEFAAAPGQTYKVFIRRPSGMVPVQYGIAWTVETIT